MKKILPLVLIMAAFCPVIGLELEHYGSVIVGMWWNEYERFYDDNEAWTEGPPLALDTITADPRVPYNLEFLPYGKLGTKLNGDENISAIFEIFIARTVMGVKMSGVTSNKVITSYGLDIIASKWFAQWDINPMVSLLLGQDTPPANLGRSNQALYGGNGLGNIGCLTTGNAPMLQFSLHAEEDASLQWEGKVAAVNPDTIGMNVGFQDQYTLGNKVSHKMPKAEGSFGLNYVTDMLGAHAKVTAGYLAYEMIAQKKTVENDSAKIDIQSHVWGAEAGVRIGPVSLSGTVSGGRNVGVYGVWIGNQFLTRYEAKDNPIVDIYYPKHFKDSTGAFNVLNGDMIEMALVLNVKPLEWLAVEGGYGTIKATHEYDESYDYNPTAPRIDKSYSTQWTDPTAWYGQIDFKIVKRLQLTCEYGQHIWGPHKGFGRLSYFGFNTSVFFQ